MIGTREDAALAASCPQEYLYTDEGCTRLVYLINGVIYKVDRGWFGANTYEIASYNKLNGKLPQGVFLPEMTMYENGVIAAEYIDGDDTGECVSAIVGIDCECDSMCIDAKTCNELAGMGWEDQSWGNARWYDGVIYLIDIAY